MDIQNKEIQNVTEQATEAQTAEAQNVEAQNAEEKTAEAETVKTEGAKDKTKKKKKWILIIIFSLLFILVAGAVIFYWRVAVYYESHFFPNTTINDLDCSELEAEQVTAMLDSQIQEYKLEVTGRLNEEGESGPLGEIGAEDINLHYVGTLSAVEHLLEQQNEWMWIEILTDKHYSHVLVQGVDFDEEMLTNYVKEWDAFQNMEKPRDAYISEYSEEKGYEIIPETKGTEFDEQVAVEYIKNAILMHETVVDLEMSECYTKAELTADDKTLNENVDAANKWLATAITYDWNGSEIIVDKELISEWISFQDNEPILDEEAVAEFVADRASELDTYGKNRYFTTTLGVQLNLPSGPYGWKTDKQSETEELIQLIYQGSTEDREPVYTSKGSWKGMNDIGNSYVEADLTNQHLYLYWQGSVVLETDFVSGQPYVPGNRTPAGVFGITYKTTNAVLRGADYETPVSYWMPFFGNFGMHDATWRTAFGGDIYLTNGSHGCINLPFDKAAELYNYVSEGFPVICYYY